MTPTSPLSVQNVPIVQYPICFACYVSSNFVSSPVYPSLGNRAFQPFLREAYNFCDKDLESIRSHPKSHNNSPVRSIKM